MIDHTMGKWCPSMLTIANSGRCAVPAVHVPTKEPTNPRRIDTRKPPGDAAPEAQPLRGQTTAKPHPVLRSQVLST